MSGAAWELRLHQPSNTFHPAGLLGRDEETRSLSRSTGTATTVEKPTVNTPIDPSSLLQGPPQNPLRRPVWISATAYDSNMESTSTLSPCLPTRNSRKTKRALAVSPCRREASARRIRRSKHFDSIGPPREKQSQRPWRTPHRLPEDPMVVSEDKATGTPRNRHCTFFDFTLTYGEQGHNNYYPSQGPVLPSETNGSSKTKVAIA